MRHFNPASILVLNAGVQSAIRLVSNIVLANLLFPEAFALTTVAMVVMIGVQMLTDVGITAATLKDGIPRDDEVSKLWTIQLVRGLALAAILAACSSLVSVTYASSLLGHVLLAMAIVPAIQGAQSLYPIIRLAHQDLRPLIGTEILGRLLGAIVSILYAIAFPTVWALVVGTIAGALATTLSSHFLGRHMPTRLDLDWSYFKEKWKFFRWIQLGSAATFVAMQADKALFPFLYGLPALGVYAIAANLALMPAQITQKWSANVYYPLVAQLIGKGTEARGELQRIRTGMLCYTALATAGMLAVAPPFFLVFYKADYHGAGTLAQVLAAQVYFEVAESSLRHFPLIAKSSRYEFLAVKVRLAAFAALAAVIYGVGLGPVHYALAFTLAQAVSYAFMLFVCRRDGYVSAGMDLPLAGFVLAGLLVALMNGDWPRSASAALPALGAVGLISIVLLALAYRRFGMPSLRSSEIAGYAEPNTLKAGQVG